METATYDTKVAEDVGVVSATILWQVAKEISYNFANQRGATYKATINDLRQLLPWLSVNQLTYGVRKLLQKEYLVSVENNVSTLDHTKTYFLGTNPNFSYREWESELEQANRERPEIQFLFCYDDERAYHCIQQLVEAVERLATIRKRDNLSISDSKPLFTEYEVYKVIRLFFAEHNWEIASNNAFAYDVVHIISERWNIYENVVSKVFDTLLLMQIITKQEVAKGSERNDN